MKGGNLLCSLSVPRSKTQCLAHTRHTMLTDARSKWTNKHMSGCVIDELNSKTCLSRTAPSEKYFRVPESQRWELKHVKELNKKEMAGYSQALSEGYWRIQPIHWLNLSRKAHCSICFWSHSVLTFESSTAIKIKVEKSISVQSAKALMRNWGELQVQYEPWTALQWSQRGPLTYRWRRTYNFTQHRREKVHCLLLLGDVRP